MIPQISEYKKWTFTAKADQENTISHDVYSRGKGKLIVIIQELPGIGQETLSLADRFVKNEYKVILPHLFGPLGKTSITGNTLRVICMRKEFKIFSKNKSSPVVDWLKALCRKVKEEHQAKGVAVIGMCLTGNFAISLMADDAVLAAYASQPSLPVLKQDALHFSEEETEKIKAKLDKIGPMHCGRFEKDKLCTFQKFELLDKTFNHNGKERIKLHTLPGKGHAVLTLDFVDKKGHPTKNLLQEIMDYFDDVLAV